MKEQSDGISSGHYDAVDVILHELGHALGHLSQVDKQDNDAYSPLSPVMQDIWRFTVSSSPQDPFSEIRIITAGFAEYDDTVDTSEMSQGYGLVDPDCPAAGHLWDAGHFRS